MVCSSCGWEVSQWCVGGGEVRGSYQCGGVMDMAVVVAFSLP